MTHRRSEKQARGIDAPFRQRLEAFTDREEFPANRTRPAVQFPRIHQAAHEISFHQQIRIERQHPFRPAGPDPLILRLRKPHIAGVPDHLNAAAEFLQDRTGTVGGGIIHHNYGRPDALLGHHSGQAAPDVPAAIESDNGNAYGRFRHEIGRCSIQRPFRRQSNYTESSYPEIFFEMV